MDAQQVDAGFWQGAGLLAAIYGGVALTSDEQRSTAVGTLLGFYRACGLKVERISDKWVA